MFKITMRTCDDGRIAACVHHGHIYTGDSTIVKHKGLRNIIAKGLGYHDQQPPLKSTAYNSIISGLDKYINATSAKLSLPPKTFIAWKCEILKKVRIKLKQMKPYRFNQVMKQSEVKKELTQLKQDFVMVPVDKASKNISFICKSYYMNILANEIENSDTFQEISDNKDQFLNNLKSRFQGDLHNDKIPFLYATAKMHKNPTAFRFITSANDTAFSKLSINE